MPNCESTSNEISLGLGDKFEKRLNKLKAGSFRIAYYYDFPDESTFRYRVYNMIQVIDSYSGGHDVNSLSASWFCLRDGHSLNSVIDNCDVIIFVRTRYSGVVANAICRARMRSRRVLYDIDDLVIDTTLIPLIISTLDQNANEENVWQYWFQYVSRLRAVLMECDAVIATNQDLAQSIFASTKKHVSVLRNFYNSEQERVSDCIRARPSKHSDLQQKTFKIGYFSGSPSHNNDFGMISGSLLNLFETDKDVELLVAGFLDLGPNFIKYSHRIERLPMMNFGPLQNSIASVCLNISPLQSNIFTSCKSELKFFEAALVNTPTLASDVGAFSRVIINRKNGWLAEPHTWTSVLDEIVDCNRHKRELISEIQRNALQCAQNNFSYKIMLDPIIKLLVKI